MADEQIRIDITAEDDASRKVDDVADKVDDLERRSPAEVELEVTADTRQAERAIEDVTDDAERLSRQDTEILLRARIDDAKAGLKSLRDDLGQTADKARDTDRELGKLGGDGGLQTRGNAIADLTGPLGDASGAASDFAGVFDGLGDIAGDVAGKVGLSASAMTSAIGGIGIAVAGAAALWTLYQGNQAKAREEQKKLEEGQRRINDAVREGKLDEAAAGLVETYKAAYDEADRYGLKVDEVTRYLTGQADSIPSLLSQYEALRAALGQVTDHSDDSTRSLEGQLLKLGEAEVKVNGARDAYQSANGSLAEQDARLRAVTDALGGLTTDTDRAEQAQGRLERQADRTRDALDRIEGALDMQQAMLNFESRLGTALTNVQTGAGNTSQDVLDIKQSILDVAEAARLTPIQVRSLLERVDQGDLDGVRSEVQGYFNRNRPEIEARLRPPSQAELADTNRRIQQGIGLIYLTAVINANRSGGYGGG